MFARLLPILLATLALSYVSGCETTDHDAIDKWTRTEKGPARLKAAVANEDLEADLSAHAAANMIKMGQDAEVRTMLETMSPGRRTTLIGKLAPRLWDIARIESDTKVPSGGPQPVAKDALVMLRKWADDTQKQQIDNYLIDWYGVTSYAGRSGLGQFTGPTVVRMIGPPIAKKLVDVMNGLIAAPGQDKAKYKIGDDLMLALAASGSPDAVKKLLDVAQMDRGDPTLTTRAFTALYTAYLDPGGLFDLVGPEALAPNLDTLVAIAKNDQQPGKVVNIGIELIRAIGSPQCFDALAGMVGVPHKASVFKYVVANNALRCGGVTKIGQVVQSMPDAGAYEGAELTGTVVLEISRMTPRNQVLEAVRDLLKAKTTIARWVAIETLAAMKSVEDKPRILALGGSQERLIGYWGNNAEGKTDPTLGQRAKELADKLGAVDKPN